MSKVLAVLGSTSTTSVNLSNIQTVIETRGIDSIYVGSPYTADTDQQMEERFLEVVKHMGVIMNCGVRAFSPIAHCHPIAVTHGLPRGWDFWKLYAEFYIAGHEHFGILKMPGWQYSAGIAAEIEIALDLDRVPIIIDPYN